MAKKNKDNISASLEILKGIRKPVAPPSKTFKDSDSRRKKKCTDRGNKYKEDYSKED